MHALKRIARRIELARAPHDVNCLARSTAYELPVSALMRSQRLAPASCATFHAAESHRARHLPRGGTEDLLTCLADGFAAGAALPLPARTGPNVGRDRDNAVNNTKYNIFLEFPSEA